MLKAERIGPGIFFALFGAVLLGHSLLSQVNIMSDIDLGQIIGDSNAGSNLPSNVTQRKITISGFGETQGGELPVSLKAVNTLISISERQGDGSEELTGIDYQRFSRAVPALRAFQRGYIDAQFEPGTFDTIIAIQEQCADNTEVCRGFLEDRSKAKLYGDVLDVLGSTLD